MPRYRRGPKLTVDAVWISGGHILLVRRGRAPFRGWWALPGGFVEPDETVERAVVRELAEETGLRAVPAALVGVYSTPGRDPRGPTVSVGFRVRGRKALPRGGDDAAEARWWSLDKLPELAFDHAKMIRDALGQSTKRRLRRQRSSENRPAAGRGGRRGRRPTGGSAR